MKIPIRGNAAATSIVVLIALCLASSAGAQFPAQSSDALLCGESRAVCYSGFRKGQHPDRGSGAVNPSEEEILEDLRLLRERAGFRLLRLYDAGENSRTVLEVIRKNDFDVKILLGAWLAAEESNPGCPWHPQPYSQKALATNKRANAQEVERAIELANTYPDTVAAVAVGNEALVEWTDHRVPMRSLLAHVRRVKKAIKQPVTVADNYDWWAKNGAALADELDFVSVHVYPVWEEKSIDEGLSYGIANMKAVRDALPKSRLVITEAGWATTASEFGERASEAHQKRYYDELMAWAKNANVTTFFFEAFDESWKGDPNNPSGAEKHWGLFTEERQPKAVARTFLEDAPRGEAPVAPAEPDGPDVDRAIARGMHWLISAQEVDGGWQGPHPTEYPAGMTGLAVYALRKCGLPAGHRVIRKGVAFMNSKPCTHTYAMGTNLLAYSALPESMRSQPRIKQITERLIDGLGDYGWKYARPNNDVYDLSNTQYALLGLRAAAAMGEKIPTNVWKRAAKILNRLQFEYGGWGYGPRDKWSDAGMTAAGVFSLAACLEGLEEARAEKRLQRDLRGHIKRGLDWFIDHWAIDRNLIVPASQGERAAWHYHFLYGLERVSALTGEERIGGHDWYEEGALWLTSNQNGDGSWSTAYGEWDVNTSLALLFLSRGTRSTKKSRVTPELESASDGTFVIRTDGKNPSLCWITRLEGAVRKKLDAGERITALAWDVDGVEVRREAIKGDFDIRADASILRHAFEANGAHRIRARLTFATSDGDPTETVTSPVIDITADDVEEDSDREAMADLGKNILDGVELTARSSSHRGDRTKASAAVDGHHSTSWITDVNDRSPWIDIELSKGVRGKTLKLVGAHKYSNADDEWSRPKDIVVTLNGRKRLNVTMPDDVRRKYSIEIPKLRLRRIRIEIKTRYAGRVEAGRVGFKEVEIYP